MNEGISDLIKGIKIYVDNKIKNISYTYMKTGIVESYDAQIKKYTVNINGLHYNNVYTVNNLNFSTNDTVKILCNIYENKITDMMIVGKIS